MFFENQKRLKFIALSLGLLSFGCGRPTETATAQRPTRPTLSAPKEQLVPSFYTVAHYGDERDVEADLKMTLARASTEKKRVLLQVGGEWCGWCKRLTSFIEKNETVRASVERNYLLMKVTFTPKQPNDAFLSKYPAIKGYPHLFVLDAEGNLLHSQDTGVLEDGKDGYVEDKVVAFLEEWKSKD